MRTMSISLQESLYERLKHSIPSKKISKFVSKAISHELERMEKELALAYKEAEQNPERNELIKEWEKVDDFYNK